MSTITKERIANLIEFNSEGSDCQANAEQWEVHELARIALTSLEAEPVADVVAWSSQNEERTCDVRLRRHDIKPGILYTAPPAPVSVPDENGLLPCPCCGGRAEFDYDDDNLNWISCNVCGISTDTAYHTDVDARDRLRNVWNLRAAMLQGADGKPELTVWYGSMPETNGKTNWTAMLHRKGQHPWEGITIDCSEYPDRVRYEADRMRHLIGELADEPDILAYDADAHSGYVNPGNSPVTQDCWCRTCRPMTMSDMRFVVCPECGNKRCPHANDHKNDCTGSNEPGQEGSAYPAAPQQEVNNV
ncbi:Lar family restriction alleviation protein [Salmonella enterica]|uniref:Lar family restriction alleviation protein n=1 Tax=Salmonella enterica TaxID=28901 RepID=UPI0009AD3FC4|nr:Lar family restriction alleviation protein [Salmonella enterica]